MHVYVCIHIFYIIDILVYHIKCAYASCMYLINRHTAGGRHQPLRMGIALRQVRSEEARISQKAVWVFLCNPGQISPCPSFLLYNMRIIILALEEGASWDYWEERALQTINFYRSESICCYHWAHGATELLIKTLEGLASAWKRGSAQGSAGKCLTIGSLRKNVPRAQFWV